MKYIKLYETNCIKRYWLLPTDNRFKKSLQDIGCSPAQIYTYLSNENIFNDSKNFVFISYNNCDNPSYEWGWNPFKNKLKDQYFETHYYKFMGIINITKDEIKYAILINKYNL